MCSPVNCMSLEDLSFFMDERLSRLNVYNILFYSVDIDLVLPSIVQMMHKFSKSQMIQEVGACYARVTFVSHISFNPFGSYLERVLHFVRVRHGLNDKSLYYV